MGGTTSGVKQVRLEESPANGGSSAPTPDGEVDDVDDRDGRAEAPHVKVECALCDHPPRAGGSSSRCRAG